MAAVYCRAHEVHCPYLIDSSSLGNHLSSSSPASTHQNTIPSTVGAASSFIDSKNDGHRPPLGYRLSISDERRSQSSLAWQAQHLTTAKTAVASFLLSTRRATRKCQPRKNSRGTGSVQFCTSRQQQTRMMKKADPNPKAYTIHSSTSYSLSVFSSFLLPSFLTPHSVSSPSPRILTIFLSRHRRARTVDQRRRITAGTISSSGRRNPITRPVHLSSSGTRTKRQRSSLLRLLLERKREGVIFFFLLFTKH